MYSPSLSKNCYLAFMHDFLIAKITAQYKRAAFIAIKKVFNIAMASIGIALV